MLFSLISFLKSPPRIQPGSLETSPTAVRVQRQRRASQAQQVGGRMYLIISGSLHQCGAVFDLVELERDEVVLWKRIKIVF